MYKRQHYGIGEHAEGEGTAVTGTDTDGASKAKAAKKENTEEA